jgi:hypothetical protein
MHRLQIHLHKHEKSIVLVQYRIVQYRLLLPKCRDGEDSLKFFVKGNENY